MFKMLELQTYESIDFGIDVKWRCISESSTLCH